MKPAARLVAAGLALLAALRFVAPPVAAQEPLVTLDYRVQGLQLRVTPAALAVPKGVPGSLRAEVVAADGSTNAATQAALRGAHLEATLRGPSFPARRLVAPADAPLILPTLSLTGDYQLDNLRLVDSATGAVRLEGNPPSVPVRVFEELLISRVTSRPLSIEEVQDRGIVIDQQNFRAVEFEVAFVLDGQTIPIRFPVVTPNFTAATEIIPAAELQARLVRAQELNNELATTLSLGQIPSDLKLPVLNLQVRGVNFQVAEAVPPELALRIPPIPALMVIPGNIGFLNQFFSVQIFTENGAPAGSGLSVVNLQARMILPPGPDGIRSTNYAAPGDDPLRFARVGPEAQIRDQLPVLGPPPVNATRLFPGETGTAEFLVEGLQEGLHIMDLDLTADLEGLAAGPVKVRGKAAGSVLVRNPKFSLSFSHPQTVRFGEPYDAYVTILNTGDTPANLVSVSLRAASISGGALESPEVVQLGNLAPGQSATATFRVRPNRSGRVTFGNLTTGSDSVEGRFNFRMGIDERGVELSPDTLALPDYVNDLPVSLVNAAQRVLGQALSVATAGRLPPGVQRVDRATVVVRALELAEAGQRVRYGDPLARVLTDLALDWQGARNFSAGFDQIQRETDAGREWREALVRAQEFAQSADAVARLEQRAADLAGRGEAWWLAASSHPGVALEAEGAAGRITAERSAITQGAGYTGDSGAWLAMPPGGGVLRWRVLTNLPSIELACLTLGTNGQGQLRRWTVANPVAGACLSYNPAEAGLTLTYDLECDGAPEGLVTGTATPVTELPPSLVNVVQDTSVIFLRPYPRCTQGPAQNYGNLLAVLFSKPMTQALIDQPSAYRLDSGNTAVGVRIQQGDRVALLSLREPVSALLPRTLTVNGVTDLRGNPVAPTPYAINGDFRDGVFARGRVLRADGTSAANVPVTVTMIDAYKDPFDQCNPVITRVVQRFTDADGYVAFDFVPAGTPFTIAAVDLFGVSFDLATNILGAFDAGRFSRERFLVEMAQGSLAASLGTNTLDSAIALAEGLDRAVWDDHIVYQSGRMGSELIFALRFRGRGIVAGRVLAPDGVTPVPGAAVNVFPDPASREQGRGVFTDVNGRFEFRGLPLGNFTVQVQTSQRHFRTVAGTLDAPGQRQDLDIVLTAPTVQEIQRTSIAGRVVEADTVTPADGARVYVTQGASVIAIATADGDGFWSVTDIPVGDVQTIAVSRDTRRRGNGRGQAVSGSIGFITTVLNGTGRVLGRVEFHNGLPAANAIVAGGETLVRTDTNGFFTLTGVPLGPRAVQVGLEAAFAPGGLPRLGSGSVNVLPGIDNFVVIRLPAVGRIIGQVRTAEGEVVPGVNVALPLPGGFAYATADSQGRFVFEQIAPGNYFVSAPAPPVEEAEDELRAELQRLEDERVRDQVLAAVGAVLNATRRLDPDRAPASTDPGAWGYTTTSLLFDGQTAVANISFLPAGRISGKTLNHLGLPISARVRATGLGRMDDGSPGIILRGTRTSDLATGEFEFFNQLVGDWGLQAASPFYPSVLLRSGRTTSIDPNVTNVVFQFPPLAESNGRLTGLVLLPDGSPASSNVNVRINVTSDYVIRTDGEGRFDTQIVIPAGTYRIEADDPATGLRGLAFATVRAGQTNFATVQLLGKGGLTVRVLRNDGSPAQGANVQVTQGSYPGDQYSGTTGPDGRFTIQNIFAGNYAALGSLLTGSSRLEARGATTVAAGETSLIELRLVGSGTVRGSFRRRADATPIVAARVAIGTVAYATTDLAGRFEVTGLAYGSYRIVATDPVTGNFGVGNATITFDGQVVEVPLVELAEGEINGQVLIEGQANPVAGATVTLSGALGLTPSRTVTTGPDGQFSFPAVLPGPFSLSAWFENKSAARTGTFPDDPVTLTVPIVLPADPPKLRLTVQVLEADGVPPATSARFTQPQAADTDPSGQVVFDQIDPGLVRLAVGSLVAGQSSSVAQTNLMLTAADTNAFVTLRLSGVSAIDGQVVQSDGVTPAVGAEVRFNSQSTLLGLQRTAVSDSQGRFKLENLPPGGFQISARLVSLAVTESGTLTSGQTNALTLRLGPSGTVIGRLLRADGVTPVGSNDVLLTFNAPSGLPGGAITQTDTNGAFEFTAIPTGAVTFAANHLPSGGLANVTATLTNNGDTLNLGDIPLDEEWPRVVAVSPPDGATGVPVNTVVELTFSEALKPGSFDAGGVLLRSPSNNVAATLQLLAGTNGVTNVIRLTPSAPLPSLTTWQVVAVDGERFGPTGGLIGRGPRDLVNRPLLAPFLSSFTTRDAEPPRLLSVFPTNGAVQIEPLAVPRLSFSEPVNGDVIAVTLTGPGGPVAGTPALGFNGTVLTFTPVAPLPVNGTFTLTVSNVTDLAGNPLTNQPVVVTFHSLDTLGPVIASLNVLGGAPSVAGSTLTVEAALAAAEPGVEVRFSRDFTPLGVATNAPYRQAVTLPTNGVTVIRAIATDRFGNDGPVAELSLTTVPNQAPLVFLTRSNPPSGPLDSGQPFTLHVSATDDLGVTNLTVVGLGTLPYSATFADGSPRTLPFTVPSNAVPGALFQFRAQATDALGLKSTEAVLDLEVRDRTAPAVTILAPATNTPVPPAGPFTLTVVSSDNSPAHELQLVLSGAVQSTQTVAVAAAPNAPVTNTIVFPLTNAPTNGAAFLVTLTATDGATNTAQLTRTYFLADLQPPRLTGVLPPDGAERQSLWSRLTVLLDEPLAPASVTTNAVRFTDAAGNARPVTLTLSNAIPALLIEPALPLAPGTLYTNALLPGLTDAAGNPLRAADGSPIGADGLPARLTTAAILDVTPPPLAPVLGGTNFVAEVRFEPGLGARFFRFTLTNRPPVTVNVATNATNAIAALFVPLDFANPVLFIAASDDAAFSRPYHLSPVPLTFGGNAVTNQPPVVELTRIAPVAGPLASGMNFTLRVAATDDFGVTNLTVLGSGVLNTNLVFTNGQTRTLSFKAPTGSPLVATQQFRVLATDDFGALTEATLNLDVLPLVSEIVTNELVFSRASLPDGAIYVAAADGANERMITVGSRPRLSLDGRYLAFTRDATNYPAGNLYVRDLLLGDERLLVNNSSQIFGYSWRPDAQQLVFDWSCALYDINRDATGLRTLFSGNCFDDAPAVNPLDGRLAWHNDRPGFGLRVAAPLGTNAQTVAGTVPGHAWAAWSADGEWLAFLSATNGGNFLKVRPDGTGFLPLTALGGADRFRPPGVWTADGAHLLAAGTVGGTNGLFAIATDGSGITLLREGDYDFVGALHTGPVPGPAPQLLSVAPAHGAVRQSLWLDGSEFLFTKAIAPTSATPATVQWTNNAGLAAGYLIEPAGTRLRVRPVAPLRPGVTYTARVRPGLTGIGGQQPVLGPDGQPLPAEGFAASFTTAALLSVLPADGATFAEGEFIEARVNYETGLGADAFRFQVDSAAPVEVTVTPADTTAAATVALPFGATAATLRIEALKTGVPAVLLAQRQLVLTPPQTNTPITFLVTNAVTLAEGDHLAVGFTASSSVGPLVAVQLAAGSAPFALLQNTDLGLLGTNGVATGEVLLSPRAAEAGTYTVGLRAIAANGVSVTTNFAVTVTPNPALEFTRWKDPVSGNWSDTNRWTAGLPSATRDAVIDLPGTYTVNLDVDANISALRAGNDAGLITLSNATRTLTVAHHSRLGSNTLFRLNGGTLTGTGVFRVLDRMIWAGGTMTGAGRLIVAPGGSLELTNTATKNLDAARVLENQGVARWWAGDLQLNPTGAGGSGRIENAAGALWEIRGDETIWAVNYGDVNSPPPSFANAGVVRKLGGSGTTTWSVPFVNTGTVEVQAGTWNWNNGLNNAGNITSVAGATVRFSGGGITNAPGGLLQVDGPLFLQAGTGQFGSGFEARTSVSVSGGTWVLATAQPALTWSVSNGDVQVHGAQVANVLTVSGGSLGGTNTFTVQSNFLWTGGTIYGAGRLIVAPGGLLEITNGVTKNLDAARVLENQGVARWWAGDLQLNPTGTGGSGRIENAAGALWEIRGDETIWAVNYSDVNSPPPSFANAGVVRKLGGSGTSTWSVPFVNTGTVEVQAGTCNWNNGLNNAGNITSVAGATVRFSGGTSTNATGAVVQLDGPLFLQGGSGQFGSGFEARTSVSVSGGTWVLATAQPALTWSVSNGDVQVHGAQVANVLTVSGGSLGGTNTFTVQSNFLWTGGTVYGAGRLIVAPGGLLEITNGVTKNLDAARVLENQGVARWWAGDLQLNPTGTGGSGRIENAAGAVWEIWGDNTASAVGFADVNSPPPSFANAGVVRKLGGSGTTTWSVPFVNTGTVEVQAGTCNWNNGLNNAGNITSVAGATVRFSGGTSTNATGAVVQLDGPLFLQGGSGQFGSGFEARTSVSVSGGTWVLATAQPALTWSVSNGDVQVHGAQVANVLTVSGGSLGGTNTFTVQSNFLWTGGTIYGAGRLIVAPGGLLEITNGVTKNLDAARVLENQGVARWWAGDLQLNPTGTGGSGRIENAAGAVWEIWGDNTASAVGFADVNSPPPSFANAGTLRKLGGSGTTTWSVPFSNVGTLEVQSGTWAMFSDATHSGAFVIAGPGTLRFASGTHTLAPGTQFSGAGTNRFQTPIVLQTGLDFGTLQVFFESAATLTGAFPLSNAPGGTLTFAKTMTVPGSVTVAGTMTLINAGFTVTISGTFTLEGTGTLNNPGTVQVQAFVNNGGTINGNAPIVIGGRPDVVIESISVPADSTAQARGGLGGAAVQLEFRGPPGAAFAVETSPDFRAWTRTAADIEEITPGRYRATLTGPRPSICFFRLVELGGN